MPPTDVGAVPADVVAVLGDLHRQVRQLVTELGRPVRRIRLRSGVTELEVQWYDPAGPRPSPPPPVPSVGPVAASPTGVPPGSEQDLPPGPGRAEPPTRAVVRAPMVGTFHCAPEPGAAPYVAVGDRVRPGQVVGIVEAMKLMNEVTAERAGRVAEVLAVDGQPVEYDQPLLALDPA
nr:biotin/lipoyl-containing protein [Micromonospora nigra]